MLVLTRKKSEMIRIGNDIVVKVIRTGRGTVKLGIEAPTHVRVLRAELPENSPAEATEHETEEEADVAPGPVDYVGTGPACSHDLLSVG